MKLYLIDNVSIFKNVIIRGQCFEEKFQSEWKFFPTSNYILQAMRKHTIQKYSQIQSNRRIAALSIHRRDGIVDKT